jgi:PadR family transcriptional regulator PadR
MSAVATDATSLSLPRNFLRPCLLMLLAEGTGHGYELLDQVHALGLARADPAGVYRCLRAMDEEGLVRSHWQPSVSGPARRTYAITDEGTARLATMSADLAQTARALEHFLDRYLHTPAARRGPCG